MAAMVASMTAFGRGGGDLVEWEIKSVNHRYLELGFRLPEPLRDLERTLREMTAARLRRGKVDAAMRLADAGASLPRVHPEGLQLLLAAVAEVRSHVPEATVDALEALRWPGVLTTDERVLGNCREAAVAGYRAALDDLVAHRRSEGEHIRRVVVAKLAELARIGGRVRCLVLGQGAQLRERLRAKLRDLPVRVDADRLEQEVALLVQRGDATEELDRLDMHIAAARASVAGDQPCGRRLDFLMQELGREANTLAAKAPLPETAALAVDLKVAVEQVREQVQNLE